MSDGCRLALEYTEGGGDAAQRPAAYPPSLFYKRVVMGDLAAARTKALAAPKKPNPSPNPSPSPNPNPNPNPNPSPNQVAWEAR